MYYVMYNKFYKKINLIYLFVLIISGTCFSQNSNSKINENPNFKKLLDLSHLITAQKVVGLNPAEVTKKGNLT